MKGQEMSAQLTEKSAGIRIRRLAGHIGAEIGARRRYSHRVALIGDKPVGPTGVTSEIVAGKPFLADADVKVA
jgi:hypothetical protein